MLALRLATNEDFDAVFPRSRELCAHEGITVVDEIHGGALRRLLADAGLGGVWMIERAGTPIGYAMVTFGYDLEFGGRDAYLTELWIDPGARGSGAGAAVLALLDPELRARGVNALHLQVRPDNPAFRLYQRAGFVASPRTVMTRRLS